MDVITQIAKSSYYTNSYSSSYSAADKTAKIISTITVKIPTNTIPNNIIFFF